MDKPKHPSKPSSANADGKLKTLATARIVVGILTVAAIVTGILGIIGAWCAGWRYGLPTIKTDDQLAIVGTVTALASFAVVVVAGLVAWMAYQAASGTPKLEPQIVFGSSQPNRPVFLAMEQVNPSGEPMIQHVPGALAQVRLINSSSYSARNPGIKIELSGINGVPGPRQWTQIGTSAHGAVIAIQWDGGVDNIIHGMWERKLPDFDMGGASTIPGEDPMMIVTVVADGIPPRKWEMPVEVLGTEEYQRRIAAG